MPNQRRKMKKKKDNDNIPLNISKIFGTIFDHWLNLIKAHN